MGIGIICALLSAFAYSIRTLLHKLAFNKGFDRSVILFFYRLLSIPLSFIILIILDKKVSLSGLNLSTSILLYVCSFVSLSADTFYFSGVEKVEISIVSIISRVSPVISLIISFVFLNEMLDGISIIGLFLVVIMSIWLSMRLGKAGGAGYNKKGISQVFIGQVFYNFSSLIIKDLSSQIGVIMFILLFSIVLALAMFFLTLKSKGFITLRGKSLKSLSLLFFISIFSYLPFLLSVVAFNSIMLPVAYSLISFSLVFSMILGYLFLGERKNLFIKLVGGVFMLLGRILVSI